MRTTKPYTVLQTIPGQTFPRYLFVIYACSLQQARVIVAAMIAGKVVVRPVARDGAAR